MDGITKNPSVTFHKIKIESADIPICDGVWQRRGAFEYHPGPSGKRT